MIQENITGTNSSNVLWKLDHAHDPKNWDDGVDDELLPMEDVTYPPLRKETSAEGRNIQYSEEWTLTDGSHRNLPQPMLSDSVDNSQGTRGMPASHHPYRQSLTINR
jgi:hypothetical protein